MIRRRLEIAAREFAVLRAGAGVIGASRVLGRVKNAEIQEPPVHVHAGLPLLPLRVDAFESRRSARNRIRVIERGAAWPQIAAAVVELVQVDMIDLSGWESAQHSVHRDPPPLSVRLLNARAGIAWLSGLGHAPQMAANEISISGVDDRELSLGERNEQRGPGRIVWVRHQWAERGASLGGVFFSKAANAYPGLHWRVRAALDAWRGGDARKFPASPRGARNTPSRDRRDGRPAIHTRFPDKLIGHFGDLPIGRRNAAPGTFTASPGFLLPEFYQAERA